MSSSDLPLSLIHISPNITLEPEGDGVRIRGWGKSGHAAMPEGTVNAIGLVVNYLLDLSLIHISIKACAPRGRACGVGQVFSLSWFSRLCAGQVFFFGQMACAPRGLEVELVFSLNWFARLCAGWSAFSLRYPHILSIHHSALPNR